METVIWCGQAQDEEEEVQHIHMDRRVGGGLGSLPGPCSKMLGGLQMAFFLEAKLFRGWRASGESVRQPEWWAAGQAVELGCVWPQKQQQQQQNFWLAWSLAGAGGKVE